MARIVLLSFFLVRSLTVGILAQSLPTNVQSEEYQVYDAAIRKMFAGDKVTFDTQAKLKQILIRDRTITDYASGSKKENWQQVKIRIPKLAEDTIAGYETNLKGPTDLKPNFDLPLKYYLLTSKECETIFTNPNNMDPATDDWSKFYIKYPESGGYISLSNVGYNKARDQALVYFVHWCGMLCGTGNYLLLSKDETGWKVDTVAMIWIS